MVKKKSKAQKLKEKQQRKKRQKTAYTIEQEPTHIAAPIQGDNASQLDCAQGEHAEKVQGVWTCVPDKVPTEKPTPEYHKHLYHEDEDFVEQDEELDDEPESCPQGEHRDPDTGKCVPDKAPEEKPILDKPLEEQMMISPELLSAATDEYELRGYDACVGFVQHQTGFSTEDSAKICNVIKIEVDNEEPLPEPEPSELDLLDAELQKNYETLKTYLHEGKSSKGVLGVWLNKPYGTYALEEFFLSTVRIVKHARESEKRVYAEERKILETAKETLETVLSHQKSMLELQEIAKEQNELLGRQDDALTLLANKVQHLQSQRENDDKHVRETVEDLKVKYEDLRTHLKPDFKAKPQPITETDETDLPYQESPYSYKKKRDDA